MKRVENCYENKNRCSVTPTAQTFIDLCDRHRAAHPDRERFDQESLEAYWRAAALANNNRRLLESIKAVEKSKQKVAQQKLPWTGY